MSNKRSKQLSEDEFSDEFFSDDDEDSYAPESEDEGSSGSESDIESARPASPFSPLVKIRGVNDKEFNARNRGLAADDFTVKKKLFERGYKSDAGSDEDDDTIQDFIEESKPRKSATKPKAPKQTTARKSKTDYSYDESGDYEVAEDNSASEDDEESRSQESDSDADDLTSRMASMKLATKNKSTTSKPVDTKKSSSQSKARKPVDSDSEDDKENDKHHGNANRGGKSKKDELVVKKETKKVESLPEPKKPMNAYAIYVKARTPALKMKHPHSNGTTIKELINGEWADLDLKTKEIYQKKAKEDKRRYESEKLDWQNQQKKLKL